MESSAKNESTTKDLINEKLPLPKLAALGFQHVLVMYSAAVIVPILLASSLKLSNTDLAFLISADLFTCGIATFIQSFGLGKHIGIKLPVVLGCAVITLGPMVAIGKADGLPAIYGAIMVSSVFVFLFSFLIEKIIKFFPPIVTGSLVTIIGFSLCPLALKDMAGGTGSATFGDPKNYLVAVTVLILILLINKFFSGFTKAIGVLLGLVLGTILASFLGMVSFEPVRQAQWFKFVTPFHFGMPKFTLSGIVCMSIFLIINIVESVGIFTVIGDICGKEVTPEDIARGIRAEGCAQLLGGLFNSFPYVTFSENAGIITMTGVKTRRVLYAASFFLILLGVIPKFAALTTIIPHPVLGGAMITLFGTIGANGVRLLSQVDYSKNENLLIVACSVGIGLSTSVLSGMFDKMPEILRMLLENGIFMGTLTAILLNILFHYKELFNKNSKA